jgi:hypothetical protein
MRSFGGLRVTPEIALDYWKEILRVLTISGLQDLLETQLCPDDLDVRDA